MLLRFKWEAPRPLFWEDFDMKRVLMAALVAIAPLSAFADVLWEQAPIAPPDGFMSDGISTGGQFWSQALADDFVIAQASTVTKITFWGASEAFFNDDLSNFLSYDVVIFDTSFNVVSSANVALASLTPTLTGQVGDFTGSEFAFTYNTNISLGAGSYFLHIGSVNDDPEGDGWNWSAANTNGLIAGNVFNGDGWFTDDTFDIDVAFKIEGNPDVVPEPASMVALGVGALALLRRRRK